MNIMLNHYLDFIKNEKNENLDEINTSDNLISRLNSIIILILQILNNNSNQIVLIRKNQITRATNEHTRQCQ